MAPKKNPGKKDLEVRIEEFATEAFTKVIQEFMNEAFTSLKASVITRFDNIDENLTSVNNDLLAIKDHLIQKLLDENAFLRERVSKLESDVQTNFQKQRENNLEITGIPAEVTDDNLEETTINILNSIDCQISGDDIQACHRLPSKSPVKKTIIKFVNRKKAEIAISNRKKLSEVDFKQFGNNFNGEENIYINENLTPYFASLAWKCRMLKRKGFITGLKVFGGSIKIASNNTFNFTSIRSDDDLKKYFSDTDISFLENN